MLCLHCGKEENLYYCENCMQEVIAENIKLQSRIKELEERLEYKPKHMKVEKEDDIWKHITLIDYNIEE